jgi:hypothetical protein
MASPIIPFWFKQRQCKAEPAGGDETLKVSGPNLGEAYLRVVREGGVWKATLRTAADGPDIAGAETEHPNEKAAWEAAFELYRQRVIV